MRDWESGQILNQYSLDQYEATWGIVSTLYSLDEM
jgi:salicylate hydroxylase